MTNILKHFFYLTIHVKVTSITKITILKTIFSLIKIPKYFDDF
jgi:hypothetical protein